MTKNIERAALVSRHVQLLSISLSRAEVTADVDPLDVPEQLELSQGFRADYEFRPLRDDILYVSVDFVFTAVSGSSDGEESPAVDLKATYLLVYKLKAAGAYPADALSHFAQLNGTYNAWPYWRELVQTVSGRAGIGSVVVPVFRPPVRELTPEEEEQLSLGIEQPIGKEDGP